MLKQFLLVLLTCAIALQLFAPATMVYAQDDDSPTPGTSTSSEDKTVTVTPTSIPVGTYLKAPGQNITGNIGDFIIRAINFLAMVIGSFSLLVIIIGGVILLGSGGSESAVQKGKDTIKYAIIGLAIALSAFYITAFVQSIFFENV